MKRLLTAALALLILIVAGTLHAQLTVDAWRTVTPPAGTAKQIALGGRTARGVVGAIDASGVIYRRDAVSGSWQPVGTGMTRLAIDPSGNFWALDTRANLQRLDGTSWRTVGAGAIALAAAPDGSIVVATNTNSLAQYDPAKSSWTALTGTGARVAVDARGLIWAVGSDGAIARRLGDAWISVPGSARDIAADALGNVVIAGRDGKVYEWVEAEVRWNEVAGAVQVSTIAVGAGQLWRADEDGRLYAKGIQYAGPEIKPPGPPGAVNADLALRSRTLSGTADRAIVPDLSSLEFVQVAAAANLSALAIGYDGSVFGTTASGGLVRWSNAQRRFNSFPGSLPQIEVGEAGLPLGANGSSVLLRHDGSAWRRVPLQYPIVDLSTNGNAVTLAISTAGQLYRLDFKGDAVNYTRLAGNVDLVAAAPDGGFWYRNNAGLLFACDKAAQCERRGLAVADIAVGPGGTVYAVDTQGNLQRYNPRTGGFEIQRRTSVARVAIGPNDRPWIIEKNGNVLAARLFERDENGDLTLAKATEATANVTVPDAVATTTGGITLAYTFTAVDVPTAAPGFPNLGAGLNDLTVGLDDQIIVTGFDANADPCRSRTTGWQGRNWIYSPSQRRFIHLDYLRRVQYQMALAARAVAFGTTTPTLAGAPAVAAFYGITRACARYYLNEYDTATFTGPTADFFDLGGLALGESDLRSNQVTANTRDLTTVLDMDVTLDNWIAAIFPERRINFIGIGVNAGAAFTRRADQKFARIGVGATRNVLWATSFESDVYEFVQSSNTFEKRNVLDSDKAQDIGVGKDGSAFIIDLAGRLKKWDKAQKVFVFTGQSGLTRVAVTSKGKPVVANFPSSQRVLIAQ